MTTSTLTSASTLPEVAEELARHEKRDEEVYQYIEEQKMHRGKDENETNINIHNAQPPHGYGHHGGNDNAALMALLAQGTNGRCNDGMMNNPMWALAMMAFLRNDHSGHGCHGGGSKVYEAALDQSTNASVNRIPEVILAAQNATQAQISQNALANCAGFANTKDAIQNGLALTNQNVSNLRADMLVGFGALSKEICMSQGALSQEMNRINTDNINRQLSDANLKLALCEVKTHASDVGSRVEVNTMVNQQQAQTQRQINDIGNAISCMASNHVALQSNVEKLGQTVINYGNMVDAVKAASTNTNVR